MAIREDLKNLQAMIQNMDNEISVMSDVVDTTIRDIYDLDIEMRSVLEKKSMEEIESMTEDDVMDCLTEGFTGEGDNTNVLHMKESYEAIKDSDKTFTEYVISILKEIKQSLIDLESLQKEKDNITKEVGEITDNYFNYVNSEEYKKKKIEKLNELKQKAEDEQDEKKKKEIMEKLKNVENTETLQFLFDRIETIGEKEIFSIMDTFFTPKRSELIMKKFAVRLPKYGYNKDLYKLFFNLEEKFLPEEYHDLNNIFLFVVMRYISYTDTYSKVDSLYVSSVLIKMYNLLYHRYETQNQENEFIELIKRLDNYFMPYLERFTKYNTTSPNHPKRKERDEKYEEKRRLMLIASLENAGVEVDTTLETEELREMLQNVIKEKENEESQNSDTTNDVIGPAVKIPVNKEIKTDEEESDIDVVVEKAGSEQLEKYIDTIEEKEAVMELDEFMDSIDTEELKDGAIRLDPPEDLTENELIKDVKSTSELESVINTIESSEHIDELDAFMEEVADEIHVVTDPKEIEKNKESDNINDDEFVVERRIGNTSTEEDKKEPTEIEVWKDAYGCYYVEDNGTYGYCDEHGNVVEEGVPEDTVLKLISGGNVTKTTIIV